MMNAGNNNQSIASDADNHDGATENEREDLMNILQNNFALSFGNV